MCVLWHRCSKLHQAARWLSWYGVGLASADRLPVVVRIPAGPRGSLKCDPPKGNGRRPQKKSAASCITTSSGTSCEDITFYLIVVCPSTECVCSAQVQQAARQPAQVPVVKTSPSISSGLPSFGDRPPSAWCFCCFTRLLVWSGDFDVLPFVSTAIPCRDDAMLSSLA